MRWSLCCVLFSFLLIHYFLFPITSVISLPSLIQKVHLKCIYLCILKLNSKLTFVILLLFASHVIPVVETWMIGWLNCISQFLMWVGLIFALLDLAILLQIFFFPHFCVCFHFLFYVFIFYVIFFYICWKGVDGGGSMRRCAENYGLVRHRINFFIWC